MHARSSAAVSDLQDAFRRWPSLGGVLSPWSRSPSEHHISCTEPDRRPECHQIGEHLLLIQSFSSRRKRFCSSFNRIFTEHFQLKNTLLSCPEHQLFWYCQKQSSWHHMFPVWIYFYFNLICSRQCCWRWQKTTTLRRLWWTSPTCWTSSWQQTALARLWWIPFRKSWKCRSGCRRRWHLRINWKRTEWRISWCEYWTHCGVIEGFLSVVRIAGCQQWFNGCCRPCVLTAYILPRVFKYLWEIFVFFSRRNLLWLGI